MTPETRAWIYRAKKRNEYYEMVSSLTNPIYSIHDMNEAIQIIESQEKEIERLKAYLNEPRMTVEEIYTEDLKRATENESRFRMVLGDKEFERLYPSLKINKCPHMRSQQQLSGSKCMNCGELV